MTLAAYLAEVEQRERAATEGPWHAWDRGIGYEVHKGALQPSETDCAGKCQNVNDEFRETFAEEDARFIAHARTDIPTLLALLRRAVKGLTTAQDVAARCAETKSLMSPDRGRYDAISGYLTETLADLDRLVAQEKQDDRV